MDAKITYIDEDGVSQVVLLSEIRQNIGWEYVVPENVLNFWSDFEIKILGIEIIGG